MYKKILIQLFLFSLFLFLSIFFYYKYFHNKSQIVEKIELDKNLDSPNRGVKQAGFYVLIGASMPNVLVESGYISNPSEERNLKKPGYRQNIAKSIYNAILKFKTSHERLLVEE